MKRLPITPEEKRLFKSLEKTAMILLLMFKIYPTPLDAETLSYEMKLDPRTADKRLDDLASEGFTLHMKGQGYVLTAQSRSLVAQLFGSIIVAPYETQALTPRSTDQASAIPALALSNSDQALSLDARDVNSAKNVFSNYTHTVCALKKKEEEDSFNLIKSSSSDSDLKSAQNAKKQTQITAYTFEDGTPIYRMEASDGTFITTREILAATEIIAGFGDIDDYSKIPVDAIKPEVALAWVAKAYDDRNKLSNAPAGLLVSRLKQVENYTVPSRYLKSPTRYLPDEYIEALRLEIYDCKSCVDAAFTTRAAYEEHVQKMHLAQPQPEEAHEFEIEEALDSDDPVRLAWNDVLEALRIEMPRASFDTWVRDTRPVQFDGKVLTVGVRNAYARDWLSSRMDDLINKMLARIMNQQVRVCFIVADVEEE